MDDLSLLREGVREAIKDICESSDGLIFIKRWHTIRAELLRLANENADYGKHAIEQYKRGVYWMDRAKEAEAELAALKARIAEADKCYAFEDFCNLANGQVDRTRRFASIRTALPESMIGQNFALVPLDDAEAKG